MSTSASTVLIFLSILIAAASCAQEWDLSAVKRALTHLAEAMRWAQVAVESKTVDRVRGSDGGLGAALRDCDQLYDVSLSRVEQLLGGSGNHTVDDARAWLSGALASHRTCLDGLEEKGFVVGGGGGNDSIVTRMSQNLTSSLEEALASLAGRGNIKSTKTQPTVSRERRTPTVMDAGHLKGGHRGGAGRLRLAQAINEALATLSSSLAGVRRPQNRIVVHVKAGVYRENVEIGKHLKNIMFVGDGIDRTIVTGSRNFAGGSSTYKSATFGVSADGFWARDMTFENTADPQKHQAVALRVASDLAVFYRCSFKGYQDTLFVHSLRQFYRDCQIYGTVDVIFGDASVVLQNCDIFIRRPMANQANTITAQGRQSPDENTGIFVQNSRVRPAGDLAPMKFSFRSYLGRPWKKYSRTVFIETDLDGLIDPSGWEEWVGSFALSTLFYGEYRNTGAGATTNRRVTWRGFHVLRSSEEATPFTVSRLLQGESWIPASGVPVKFGL